MFQTQLGAMDSKTMGLWTLCVLALILPHTVCSLKYIGCYRDRPWRAMKQQKNVKSIEDCINICRQRGTSKAGLQFGGQCFCGENYKKYGVARNCNMRCKSRQICGGFWSMSIYQVGSSAPLRGRDCSCSASGDPHYRTFDGQMIHFMGICKYTLATSTKGAPHYFAVQVKNEHRGNRRVSYTRMVDVKLKGVTIRLLQRHVVLVNGERRSLPLVNIFGFTATYSGGWVTVTTKWGLRVQFDGRHRVSVKVPGSFANKLTGICGNCNRKRDDYRTQEGKDVSRLRNKYSLIGSSYKVNDDSDKPQTKCTVTDVTAKCPAPQTRKCNAIMGTVFAACRKKLGQIRVKEYIKSCKMDVCLYHKNKKLFKTVLTGAIEGFARECEKIGIIVNWRPTCHLEMKCGRNMVYKYNALVCQPSCTNRKPKCTARAEGCVCRKGLILSGDKCVPLSKCGCNFKGIYLNVNEVLRDSKCRYERVCLKRGRSSKMVRRNLKPCGLNSVCGIRNGVRGCVCKKGFTFNRGMCLKKQILPPRPPPVVVNPCKQRPCKNGGRCSFDGKAYKCKCRRFFIGKHCEKRNRCSLRVCRNGGICSNDGNTYKCACPKSFSGKRCEIRDPCTRKPCKNGGVCSSKGRKYTCGCPKGFYGHRCHKRDPCTRRPCRNGGVCSSKGHRYKCACSNGFYGRLCHIPGPCSRKPCRNGGVCSSKGRRYSCACSNGFYGRRCHIPSPCTRKPCKNGGVCSSKGRKYKCGCPKGFYGHRCHKRDPCTRKPCRNGGVCSSKGHRYKCACSNGFYGRLCHIPSPCTRKPCRNGGVCSSKGRRYSCVCSNGFYGRLCHIPSPCTRKPCKNGGVCSSKGRKYKCGCPKGFYGHRCHKRDPCTRKPCRNGGVCSSKGHRYKCACSNGFYGRLCHIPSPCSRKPCKNGGVCSSKGRRYKCTCSNGFYGRRCHKQKQILPPRPPLEFNACKRNPCKNGGVCSTSGRTYKCKCQQGFFGRRCHRRYPACKCSASGDPHYRTFDGQMIHFMGICKYTLATGTKGAPHYFAVEVKNEHRRNRRVSYTRMVDVKLKGVTIRLLPRHKIIVNGERRTLPLVNTFGFTATYSGGWVTVTTKWGLRVQFDGRHRVSVKVPGSFANKLTGICGNCNRKRDDFRTKEGKDVSRLRNKYSLIGSSYKVNDDSDKPQTKCTVTDVTAKCPAPQTRKCNAIMGTVFAACRKRLGRIRVREYIKSCKMDVCLYHKNKKLFKTVLTGAIEGFARECEKIGIIVNWRPISHLEMKCGRNMVYKYNALVCQPSCTNRKPKCTARAEGCVCRKGLILSGDKCVPLSKCGCNFKGIYLNVNEVLRDSKCRYERVCLKRGRSSKMVRRNLKPCGLNSVCGIRNGVRSCVCKKGFTLNRGMCWKPQIQPPRPPLEFNACKRNPCKNGGVCSTSGRTYKCKCQQGFFGRRCHRRYPACKCSASGDPHYRTFDGQMIHFMGICKYTLATGTKGAPHYFAVEVKNEHRRNRRVSYTRMVDVKLKGVTIRLLPRHKIIVNGERRSLPLVNIFGFTATYSGGWVTVTTKWGLRVQFDGRHRVSVKVPGSFANKLTGICGNCNRKRDDFRTKEGKDVSRLRNKYSLIGSSYKVNDDSDKPQTKCTVTDVTAKCPAPQTRKCNAIMGTVFAACRKRLGRIRVREYIKSCKMDVCLYHKNKKLFKTVLTGAIEGFARECEKIGIIVNWRPISHLEMKCGRNMVYKYNALVCQPSCTNRKPKCTTRAEGCVCRKGLILSGDKCVPLSKCGCNFKGIYLNVNEVLRDSKCRYERVCLKRGRSSKMVRRNLKPCGLNSVCGIRNGVRGCVCKKGFTFNRGMCLKKQILPPRPPPVVVNPCKQRPCKNGGRCSFDGKAYTCKCRRAFIGKHCEKRNRCSLRVCRNGGICSNDGNTYKCACPKSFSGKRCEIRDPCSRKPCRNGGICTSKGRRYSCACSKGFTGRRCHKRVPDCVCSGSGDPHYKTFDGQWIHFMGVCKYTLATPKKTSRLPHFSVEVKNEHRGNTRVSYTRLVDLKLNGATIRLLPGSKLSVNGELMTLPLKNYMGFSAVYSAGWVKVTTSFGVKVQFDGRHRVIVRTPSMYRNHLTGICGDCNGKKDDYKTKTGVDVSRRRNKYAAIGRSYEVIDDSDKPQKNCKVIDFVHSCKGKGVNACKQLSNRKGPFGACLKKLGAAATDYFKSCKIDACAYVKTPKVLRVAMCQSYEALAKKCEALGILINWRPKVRCPLKCPKDKVYTYKTKACQPSCSDRKPACKGGFMEGCVCKPGTILSGEKCVPIKSCGCTFDGMYLEAGSSILLNDCKERISCLPGGKIAKKPGCGSNTICEVQAGQRLCGCKDGFKMYNGKCRKVLIPPPPIVAPEYLGPVMHMFVRVSIAYIEGKKIKTLKAKIPKECARHCLRNKKCKSFNFDELKQNCELFPINGATKTITTGNCPYTDYYQLIDSKKIVIRGASIFTCVHLEEYAEIATLKICREKCLKDKCKAFEFSTEDKECSVTHTTRKSFGLTGNEDFNYYETLDHMPSLPTILN